MRKLFVTRHGETLANRLDIYQGRLNNELTSLTQKGLERARNLASFCRGRDIQKIYSSPLKRAYTTALEIGKNIGIDVVIDKRLVECCYGQWEGRTRSQLQSTKEWNQRQINKYSFVHPGVFTDENGNTIKGESYKIVYDRMISFIDYIIRGESFNVGLVVSHLGVIRVMAKYFNGLSEEEAADFSPKSGEIYEILLSDKPQEMIIHNANRE